MNLAELIFGIGVNAYDREKMRLADYEKMRREQSAIVRANYAAMIDPDAKFDKQIDGEVVR